MIRKILKKKHNLFLKYNHILSVKSFDPFYTRSGIFFTMIMITFRMILFYFIHAYWEHLSLYTDLDTAVQNHFLLTKIKNIMQQ